MIQKFKEGLVFGLGFGISFIALSYIFAYLLFPIFVEPQIENSISNVTSNIKPSNFESIESWNSLSPNEMIKKSSALIVIRYKPMDEDLMTAYIAEIYKKDASVEVSSKIGDRRENSDFYARGMGMDRNGSVVLLTGSPAKERSTLYLYDNRLAGAGDMPLEVLTRNFRISEKNQ